MRDRSGAARDGRAAIACAHGDHSSTRLHRVPAARPALAALLVFSWALTGCAGTPIIERIDAGAPLDRTQVAHVDTAQFLAGEFVARDGTHLPWRLLRPATIEPGRRYPLVLQLHSSGGIGADNQRQLEVMAKAWALPDIRARYPAFVLVPQFPVRSANYDDPDMPRSAVASPALGAAMELVDHFLREETAIDPARVYATGFSMGGSAAWLAPTLRPGRFAAILPVAGIAPADDLAPALRDLPILALHGDADTENPIDADRRMIARLHAIGGRKAKLRQYTGLAHSPPGDQLPGLWWRDWLFAQHRQPVSP